MGEVTASSSINAQQRVTPCFSKAWFREKPPILLNRQPPPFYHYTDRCQQQKKITFLYFSEESFGGARGENVFRSTNDVHRYMKIRVFTLNAQF